MRLLDKFLEYFRKKEYFEVDYDNQNVYSISFKEVSEDDLGKIRNVIVNFGEADSLVDYKSNLSENSALVLDNINNLMLKIKETITEDYKETYFEAIKENWNFNYFLSDSASIYHQTILINNRLSYPENLKMGDVIYPILAIKKYKGNYYFWNLLDKDDVDI